MKTIVIDLGAAWDINLKTWQNGDKFREPQTDEVSEDIGNKFGFLKTYADGKASLDGASNVWQGTQVIQPLSGGTLVGLTLYREMHFVDSGTSPAEATRAGLHYRETVLTDANVTLNPDADVFIVPQITANRTYKFAGYGGNDGRRIRVVRPRTADAFTVTIQDGGSVTACVFPSSAAAWVDLEYRALKSPSWLPRGFSDNLTSMSVVV